MPNPHQPPKKSRRKTMPTYAKPSKNHAIQPSQLINNPPIPSALRSRLEKQALLYTAPSSPNCDISLSNEIYFSPTNYASVLTNLTWRLNRQIRTWGLFTSLVNAGLVSSLALRERVDVSYYSDLWPREAGECAAVQVRNYLCRFAVPWGDWLKCERGDMPVQERGWDEDLLWLAILIVRGGEDFREVVGFIARSGVLGEKGGEIEEGGFLAGIELGKYNLQYGRQDCTGTSGSGSGSDSEKDGVFQRSFGFILPHDLGFNGGGGDGDGDGRSLVEKGRKEMEKQIRWWDISREFTEKSLAELQGDGQ